MARVPASHPVSFAKSAMREDYPRTGGLSQRLFKCRFLALERGLSRLSVAIVYPGEGSLSGNDRRAPYPAHLYCPHP